MARKLLICFIAALAFTACGKESTRPSEQAAKALNAATEGLEKARSALQSMSDRSQELQRRIERQQAELDSVIQKRIALYRQELGTIEQRLYALPAAQENDMKQRLAELKKRLDEVANQYRAYDQAKPQESDEALRQIETALKEFKDTYQQFETEIQAG